MKEELTFEQALRELEQTVARLEEGDLTLDQSLELYERGQKLARFCQEYLEQASLRVEFLSEDGEIIEIQGDESPGAPT